MITSDLILRFAPNAWQGHVQALVDGIGDLTVAGINTPLRWCHFLAQIAHESGDLTFTREDTRWSGAVMKRLWPQRFPLGATDPRIIACRGDPEKLANLAYSNRADLGNLGENDGWDYRGGGLIQITGRSNFHAAGLAIGYDLEGQPELIENPTISLKVALWYWTRHELNGFADHNYGRAVSNAINRGSPYSSKEPIGYQHRGQRFVRAWAIWGAGLPLPTNEVLHLGAYDGKVTRIQGQLKELGYALGAQDGVYGPTMARAIAAFKADQVRAGTQLEPGDEIGPLTVAALDTAEPVQLSPDRTGATLADLGEAGSTEVRAGGQMQAVGGALTGIGALGAASQTGAMDFITAPLQAVSALRMTIVPALAAIQWGLNNLFWVALIIGGIYCWRSGWAVKAARLLAHQLGWNLSR